MKFVCFAVDALSTNIRVKIPKNCNTLRKRVTSRPGVQVEWELLTGRSPEENGIFSDVVKTRSSPYKKLRFLDWLPNNKLEIGKVNGCFEFKQFGITGIS